MSPAAHRGAHRTRLAQPSRAHRPQRYQQCAGADPAAVAAFLGHESPQATRRFYAMLAVVPRPVPLTMVLGGVKAG